MTNALAKASISELFLLFILIFVLPLMTLMLLRIRRYEQLYGLLPEKEKKKKGGGEKQREPAPDDDAAPDWDQSKYPYVAKAFLSPADRACLEALRQALGEVEVYPKVALWELVDSAGESPEYAERLRGKDLDFLVCDRRTGMPLTGVQYRPGKGRPSGPADELERICKAAGTSLVFIDMAEEYDVKTLKDALGIPDLEL